MNCSSDSENSITLSDRISLASEYSVTHEGDALLVVNKKGEVIYEDYQNGYNGNQLHLLASGSKSFSCAIAVSAISDGFLSFDEKVADIITEWQSNELKSTISYRQLLNLTSGLPSGDSPLYGGASIPETETKDAIDADLVFDPGTDFVYGQSNYQVFTEAIYRKLQEEGIEEDPADYLERKTLNPIGLRNLFWVRDKNSLPYLAGGGFSTAREWYKFGLLILNNGNWNGTQVLDEELLSECFQPESVNNAYGLTFWLNSDAQVYLYRDNGLNIPFPDIRFRIPMAAGAFNQRMYLLEEEGLVVVRLGREDYSWSDTEFLSLLIDGEEYRNTPSK